jgi:phosphotriesterase-related protein
MSGRVRTVLGDVEPSSLGMTLVHEHLVVDWGELQGRPKLAFDYETTVELIAGRLRSAAADGIGALGECTPIGTGRYVDLMVDVSRRSGVAIVAATGFFHEGWTPVHPIARALDLDALTDLYTRELTEGMGSTRPSSSTFSHRKVSIPSGSASATSGAARTGRGGCSGRCAAERTSAST